MSPSKYAKRNDKDFKRHAERAMKDATQQAEQGGYVAPSSRECEAGPLVEYAPSDSTRLYAVMFYLDGQLAKFTLLHFIKLRDGADGWYNLARVDCEHGHIHLHFDDEGASKKNIRHLRRLDSVNDVADGYDDSYAALFDEWAEHERRFSDAERQAKRRRPTQRLPQADPPPDCVPGA